MATIPSGAVRLETYKELLQAFVDIDQRLHRIYDGPYILNGKLYMPASMFAIDLGAIGSGGERVGPSDALGRKLVTEASGAGIKADLDVMAVYEAAIAILCGEPSVAAAPYNATATALAGHHLKVVIPLAAVDGGGLVAATPLVTGPAGYYPVIDSILIVSDVADAAITFTFACATGALVGKAAHGLVLVAHTMNTQLKDLLLYNLTDASAITVAVSAGTAGAFIWVQVEYHYET